MIENKIVEIDGEDYELVPNFGVRSKHLNDGTYRLKPVEKEVTFEYIYDKLSPDVYITGNSNPDVREKLKAIRDLLVVSEYLNEGWKPRWGNHSLNWVLYENNNSIKVAVRTENNVGISYFKTKELAERAIKIIGEDGIKTALL